MANPINEANQPSQPKPAGERTPEQQGDRGSQNVERSADAGKSERVVKKEEADETVDIKRRPSL
jgi:hypothetical protein